jgi:hypothetical protein
VRAVAALVGLLAVLPGAAVGQSSPLAEVQRVLDAREAAVRSGDRGAFLATVDPSAPAAFKEAQGKLFDGLRSLPLEKYELEARVFDSGDLSRRGPGSFLPETRQRMRLAGYDAVDAIDSLWLTFVQRESSWLVAADDELSAVGLDTARGLWDYGPVVASTTPHFLLLSHPEQVERVKALGGLAERAVAELDQRWPLAWPEKIPLVLPGSIEELAGILQSTIDLTKFVAFVSYGSLRDGGWAPTAPRIYIQDRNLSKYSERFQVETLVHELAHAAMAVGAGPFVPAWVHEGVADWVATGQSLTERDRGSSRKLPRDFEFSTGSQASIIRSYTSSRQAMSTLAGAKGKTAPTSFFAELGGVRVATGGVDYQVDAALRRSAGMSVSELEALWHR